MKNEGINDECANFLSSITKENILV